MQTPGARTSPMDPTANENERFKRSFSNVLSGSLIAATVIHFAIFALSPQLVARDVTSLMDGIEVLELPKKPELPPPPEPIAHPATPVVATAEIDETVTIPPNTFDAYPAEVLAPPPDQGATEVLSSPTFTPYTVRPEIKNVDEVVRAMGREYPAILRDAGIGGRVVVWLYIDEEGAVRDKRIAESSGHQALDDAAMEVADVYEFTPALNRDQRVSVWVQFPITFQVR